jgi:hypothetical protein
MEPIEDLLRRYRPAGPPHGLRDRVGRSKGRLAAPRRWHEWSLPLAAAVTALAFYLLGSRVQRELRYDANFDAGARQAAIASMTDDVDGDDIARREAEHIVDRAEYENPDFTSVLELLGDERPMP